MITNNYGMGLEREIKQLTTLYDIAVSSNFEEDVISFLNDEIVGLQKALDGHNEAIRSRD